MGDDGGERGLALRFVKLVSTAWNEDQVREELNALRGKDEEADMQLEAEAARSQQLSLQPLYAKPPPIWLHPAFAAEFGDAFIASTGQACPQLSPLPRLLDPCPTLHS